MEEHDEVQFTVENEEQFWAGMELDILAATVLGYCLHVNAHVMTGLTQL